MIAVASTAGSLLRVLYSSIVASAAVAAVFSLAILGAVRAADMRREDRSGAAAAYTTLAAGATLGFIAILAYGIVLMAQKS